MKKRKTQKPRRKTCLGFCRKKYVKGLSTKKKVVPQLQVDFLQGANSSVHTECMKVWLCENIT